MTPLFSAAIFVTMGLFGGNAAQTAPGPSAPPTSAAPDRSAPPVPGPPPALQLPSIARSTLSNGIPVFIVERHKVPLAHVLVVLRGGASADPAASPGLASLTASLLDRGAGARLRPRDLRSLGLPRRGFRRRRGLGLDHGRRERSVGSHRAGTPAPRGSRPPPHVSAGGDRACARRASHGHPSVEG